jgi:hypothetical protein
VSGGSVKDKSFKRRLYVRVMTREHKVKRKLRVQVRARRVRGRR